MGWHIRSTRALAKVLLVDESAIRRAERDGRISREPSGAWEIGRVIASWRGESCWFPGRARPWLDCSRRITALMRHQLLERAEAVGAVYVEDADDDEDDLAEDDDLVDEDDDLNDLDDEADG